MSAPIARVLIVDDSALVRSILHKGLSADPRIEVVATAGDPYQARDRIAELRPNVLTLDIEMPRMNGLEFLRRMMAQFPIPTVIVSSLSKAHTQAAADALAAGATHVVAKPEAGVTAGLNSMMQELRESVVRASQARLAKIPYAVSRTRSAPPHEMARSDGLIAVGSSTGGPAALMSFLTSLPVDTAGVVVAQHMPPGFTAPLAARLGQHSGLICAEATDGARVTPGTVWIAPGTHHLRVVNNGAILELRLGSDPKVNGHRPSADVLFESVAKQVGRHAVGVILTGMGRDGARGLKSIRDAGGRTLAQNEASCVVYGMPKAAVAIGAVEQSLSLEALARRAAELARPKVAS